MFINNGTLQTAGASFDLISIAIVIMIVAVFAIQAVMLVKALRSPFVNE